MFTEKRENCPIKVITLSQVAVCGMTQNSCNETNCPFTYWFKDLIFLLSLLPDWVKEVPKGLDATFYGTGSYEGDLKVKQRIEKLLA